MTQEDRIFQETNRAKDFSFDEKVATVFDDMVSRSVPFYSEVQRIQSDLIIEFLPDIDGVVCDLGCSTGTTIDHILKHPKCPKTAKFVGFDNSPSMLDKAGAKLSSAVAEKRVSLQIADLSNMPALPACSVVILNWTLQFVRPIDREHLLKNIYDALLPGGVVFLSEKILSDDSALNRIYIEHYLEFKKSKSGYTDAENQRKREALENVLVPYRLDENYLLLKRAGFTRIDTFFRWFNFACMVAIK